VPRVKLACGRVGDGGNGMEVQQGRPALRLLSEPAACMSRQLVYLHGAGNWSPHVVTQMFAAWGRAACRGPHPSRSRGRLVRGGDWSCEAETCRARRRHVGGVPLVGNQGEMQPTSREHCVLPVRVLTRVLSPPHLESRP
jgi:hypothetical protein